MDNKLKILDYIIIILMLVLSTSVGIYFRFTGGRQKTIDEYLMGDKKMRMFPVSVSLMASFMSANALLGIPAETYLYGTQYSMWMLGSMLGASISIFGLLPVYFHLNINCVNEYLGIRFGSPTRSVVAFLQLLSTIFYTAVVLYSPSLALNAITGISTWAASIFLACVCTLYCSLGGIKAVLWTDIFQAILMCITLIAVIVGGTIAVGFFEVLEKSKEGGRFIFFDFSSSLTERYTFWNCIAHGIFLTLGAFGTCQTELQRVLSIGALRKGQLSALFGSFFINMFCFMCIWSGIVIFAIFEDCDPILSSSEHHSPDQVIPLTIMKLFNNIPGLTGLCIAGIFSASLSSVSSTINAMTSITVEDFLKPYSCCKCFSDSRMACAAKLIVVVYGAFCLLLSLMVANFRGILEANAVMGGVIGGPVVGIFLLGMFSKCANQPGALMGLVTGFAFGLWSGFGTYIAKIKVETLPRSTSGCPVNANETLNDEGFFRNFSISNEKMSNDTLSSYNHHEGYIFPLYEIAYLWIPIFACLITIITGVLSSSFLSCCFDEKEVHPQILSPIVRKLYFRSKAKSSYENSSHENLTCRVIEQRDFKTFGEANMTFNS